MKKAPKDFEVGQVWVDPDRGLYKIIHVDFKNNFARAKWSDSSITVTFALEEGEFNKDYLASSLEQLLY